jgi:hypothetical protein
METLLTKIDDRRKSTDLCYKHEDGNVFLLDYLNDTFCDIGYDNQDFTNLSVINELFNEYFNTGGKEAGEYTEAAHNLLNFINAHYDFLKEQFIYKKKNNLFNGDFYWFFITEYQQYISIMNPNPLNK